MLIDYPLFDTHCHLDFSVFDKQREALLKAATHRGLIGLIIPSVHAKNWEKVISVSQSFPNIYYALGIHPLFLNNYSEKDIISLESNLKSSQAIAVGEIGLDFFQTHKHNAAQQIDIFQQHIEIANAVKRPVILHVRKAHHEVLKILKEQQFTYGGCVHAYSGDLNQAKHYQDLGFKLGIGGSITYSTASKRRALVKALPLDSLVLETDAPDMKPAQCHHDYNRPESIFHNFNTLCDIREESKQKIAQKTTTNALQLFNICI